MLVFSPWWCMHAQKRLNKKVYKNSLNQSFQYFQALKITFKWTCGFCRYELVYTYRRQEFQHILERKLCNYFGQLLLYKKMLNMGLNMMLIVLKEFAYIRHSWTLQKIWYIPSNLNRWWSWESVCNIIRFFFICFMGRWICYKPWWQQNTGKHWNKVRHWL